MQILDIQGYSADVFYVLLLYSGKYEFLPELYDVLGKDLALRVLDIFAGTRIKFPPLKEIRRLGAEVHIYLRIKNAQDQQRSQVVKDLSDEYGLSTENVRDTFERTRAIIEGDLGMKVLHGKKRRYRIDTD